MLAELPLFLSGLGVTLRLAVGALLLSMLAGTAVALLRVSPFGVLRALGAVYVEFLRNTPLLVQMFFWVFGLPFVGIVLPEFGGALLGLGFYTSAFVAEAVRAGIRSVGHGQIEAARSLGLSYLQAMRFVVLPQALRRMVPPQVSQLITLIKDTSLAYVIGTHELLNKVKILYSGFETGPLQGLFVAAVIYFVINFGLSLISRRLEVDPSAEARTEIAAEAGTVSLGRAGA